jgi:hypothetical protein
VWSFRFALFVLIVMLVAFPAIPAHADDKQAAVQSLVERRAQAVRDGNENAFLATVDPQATDAFKNEQRQRFLGLQSIPKADYRVEVTEAASGDLASGLRLDIKYATRTYMPSTREHFRLGDYDEHAMRNEFWYTYVERDDQWFVGSMDDARVVGLDGTPNIWDEGPVAVQQSPNVVVLSAPDQTERARAVLSVADEAISRFDQAWPLPWSGKIPIVLPASPDQAARLLRTSTDVANFSAFTTYTPTRDNDWQASPPRMYAQEGNLAKASRQSQIDTIVHELVHAASAPLTGPNTPIWMQEGLAEWIRLGKPTSVKLREGSVKTLPESEEFATRDSADLSRAYNRSTVAMAFLANSKGSAAPFDLFVETGKKRSVIGSPSFNADEAMKDVTGWSTRQFVETWGSP